MYDNIRTVKDYDDALDKIQILKASGFIQDPYIKYICDKVTANPDNYFELERLFYKYDTLIQEAKAILYDHQIKAGLYPFYPPPQPDEMHELSGNLILGIVNEFDQLSALKYADLTRGFHIVGETGSGKSYMALRMFDYMLSIPIEKRGFNIVIIQVLKRDADFLIRKHKDLRIIDYKNLRYNMWQIEPWDDFETKMKTSVSIFSSVNYMRTVMQPFLKAAVRASYEDNPTPIFTEIRNNMVVAENILDQKGPRTKDATDSIKARIYEYEDTKDIFNCRFGYRVDNFWSKEDIIVNMIGEPNDFLYSTFINDLLISLQRYQTKQPDSLHGMKTLVVIDECRTVFPNRKDLNDFDADRFLEIFITTARSSGIGRITLTQEPHSVSEYLSNNSAYFLSFPITGTAIDHLKKYQNMTDEQAAFIQALPEYGVGIMRDRRFNRLYTLQVPGDLIKIDITESEVEDIMKPYIKNLIDSCKPLQAVIVNGFDQNEIDYLRKKISGYSEIILRKLGSSRYLNKTRLTKYTSVSQKRTNDSIEELQQNGLITTIDLYANKSPTMTTLYPITMKGFEVLGLPQKDREPSPKFFRHHYYCGVVLGYLMDQKYTARLNYAPKNYKGLGEIDVYAYINGKKTGFEITLSFSNLIGNIIKCDEMKMDEIIIVCETSADCKTAIDKIQRNQEQIDENLKSKIKIQTIQEYF